MGGGELWSSSGRRILAALALIAALALAVSTAARGSVVRDAVAVAASCGTDEFDGTALDDARWDVLRPAAEGLAVDGGKLNLTLRNGDLIGGTASAENVVLQDAPAGGWTATTKLNVAAIDANGEQAGLVLWRQEGGGLNAFGKVMFNQVTINNAPAKVVEAIWTERGGQAVPTNESRAVLAAAPTDILLRLRHDGARVTAEYSVNDGADWVQAGQSAGYPGDLRVGVMAIQGTGGNAGVVPFERFVLECAPTVTASAPSGTAPFEATFTSSADGAWSFGDGTPAGAGTSVTHTFTEPGVYRVRQTVGGVTGSTVVTVQPATAPALPQSDEFSGNELDPKWEVLRQRHTGITMSGGSLRLQQYAGDMHGGTANAFNVLLQNAPQGCAYTVTTRLDVQGMTATGDQAGLILWRSETPYFNFSKVVFNRRGANDWWVERSNTVGGVAQGTTNTAITGVPTHVFIRLNVSADGLVQPERSTDGTTWTAVGGAYSVASHEQLKIGLAFFGSNSFRSAAYDYFRVESQGPCDPPPPCPAATAEAGFTPVWDGRTVDGWRQAGPGTFAIVNDGAEGCRLESRGGLGLLWYELAQYDEFVLRLQFKTQDDTDNSGVFVRFPNPQTSAQIPIDQGHEIQIREGVDGDGENQKTGSIYNLDREDARAAKPAGEWNDYEIRFENGTYTITLNGTVVNTFTPTGAQVRNPGYIGLQNHGDGDRVSFRNIRAQHIDEPYQPNLFTTIGITEFANRDRSEIRGPYSFPAQEMPPSGTRGPAPEDTFDEVPVRMPNTSGTVSNLAAFRGQTLPLRQADQRVYSKIHFFGTTADGSGGGDFVLRFADRSQQIVPVAFNDWCQSAATPALHTAIGPLSQRHRPPPNNSDGARCSIFHVPADVAGGSTLVSVTLPRGTTSGSGGNRVAYLMGLTLEEPNGGFRSPDLSGQVQFADDQTSPVSRHTVDPAAPGGGDGWYTEPVEVALSAADETGGSGLQRIQYRLNGGVAQDYAGTPIEIEDDGAFTFEYRAIDVAGNAEGFKAVPIKVDQTAPETTVDVEPSAVRGPGLWDDRPATVTITGRDGDGSGVALTEVHFGDGNWQPYAAPINLGTDGRYELHVRSSDVAGNDEDEQVVSIGIDQTAPTSAAQLTSADPRSGGVHAAPVTVALSASDPQSGVAGTEYRLDNGQWQPYSAPFTVSALGGHLVEHRARDKAGNLENAKEAVFAIVDPSQLGAQETPLPPEPFVGLMPINRVAVGALLRGDLRVRASCVAVGRGTLALTVTRRIAKRLGLGRRTTLARRALRCGDESRVTVALEPGRRVKRALRRADGPFAATLRLRMNGTDGPASDTEKLTLRG